MKIYKLAFIILLIGFFSSCTLFQNPEKKVQESYNLFVTSLINSDWETAWDLICYENQKQYDEFVFQPFKSTLVAVPDEKKKLKIPTIGVTIADIENMTPEQFFALQMGKTALGSKSIRMLGSEKDIEKIEVNKDKAIIYLTGNKKINMNLENGKWRIMLFKPGKLVK